METASLMYNTELHTSPEPPNVIELARRYILYMDGSGHMHMYRCQHDNTWMPNAHTASYYLVTRHSMYLLAHWGECASELSLVLLQVHNLVAPHALMYVCHLLHRTSLNIVLFKIKLAATLTTFQISAQLYWTVPKKWNSCSFTLLVPYSTRHLQTGRPLYKSMPVCLSKCSFH